LAPAPGVTPPNQDGASYRFLSDVIMARGLVDPAAMKAALQASLAGRSLTEILVDRGELSEADLARTIAEHHRLDHVDLELFEADREAATLIGPDLATRLGAVPIAFLPTGALVVALHDPNGSPAVREIAQLIDRTIQPAIASRTQIVALIDSLRRGGHGTSTPPRNENEERAHAADEFTRIAEARTGATEERAGAAEDLGPSADACVHAAEESARAAEECAICVDERALAAEAMVEAANARAEGMMASANVRAEGLMAADVAANEALARLVGNCEMLEREAQAREGQLQALRSELDCERTERARLEAQLRQPPPGDELIAMHVRVAELERELDEERVRSRQVPASEVRRVAPAAEADDPAPAAELPTPAPVEPVLAEPQVERVPVEHHDAPSIAPTIDILGDPGVPYLPALAPMPPPAPPRKPAKSAAKATGLRRLIGALKRG
jgi:hypothetical protein